MSGAGRVSVILKLFVVLQALSPGKCMDLVGSSASLSISASIEISRANQLEEPDAQSPRTSQEEGVAHSPAGYLTWLPPPFTLHWAAAAGDGSQGNPEPGQAHLLSAKGGVLTQIPAGLWELLIVRGLIHNLFPSGRFLFEWEKGFRAP